MNQSTDFLNETPDNSGSVTDEVTKKEKYGHQKKYFQTHKPQVAKAQKKRYLAQKLPAAIENLPIREMLNQDILDEAMDWYLNLSPHAIRGYKVEIKFKTILYLLLKLKYGHAVLYDEFQIEIPGRHTQLLKSKLLQEYARIYTKQLGANTERLTSKDYVYRFNAKYPLTQDQKRYISDLYNKTHAYLKQNNKSPDPRTYAGALIYMATRGKVTQTTIATEFGITPNGLRNIQRQIKEIIGDNTAII